MSERDPSSPPLEARVGTKASALVLQVTVPAMFAATAHVLGLLRPGFNLEPKTLIVTLAGRVGGVQAGALTGLVTGWLHNFLNPHGTLEFLGLAACCASWAIAGMAGGLGAAIVPSRAVLALTGIALTAIYQVLVNAAAIVTYGQDPLTYITLGMPWTVGHILSNGLIFAIVGPALFEAGSRARSRLASR